MRKFKNPKGSSYDLNSPFDYDIIMDLPFSELNAAGRKEKKKHLKRHSR